jgi:hypothetical protein
MEGGLCYNHAVSVSVNPPLLTFGRLNHNLWNLVFISWHLSPISTGYFVNPSHQSVCQTCVFPFRCYATASLKRYRGNAYTRKKRRISERVIFNGVRIESKECRWLILPRNYCFNIIFPSVPRSLNIYPSCCQLNGIKMFSSYTTDYKLDSQLIRFREIISVYSSKHIHTLSGKNAEFFNVEISGT